MWIDFLMGPRGSVSGVSPFLPDLERVSCHVNICMCTDFGNRGPTDSV